MRDLRSRRLSDRRLVAEGYATIAGGTITNDGVWQYHAFTDVGEDELEVLADGFVDLLLVGGGGGGGVASGGGGGGGEPLFLPKLWLSRGTYPVEVGDGGAGSPSGTPTPSDIPGHGGMSRLGPYKAIGGGHGGFSAS